MERQEAIDIVAEHRRDALSVATMGSMAPWRQAGQTAEGHLDVIGCMGSASSVALGLALGRPGRKVLVLDGDGSLLMQLGSLVTIGGIQPANLYHFVFANGVYMTTGNQRLPGLDSIDFPGLALGAGYRQAVRVESAGELREALPSVLSAKGPALVQVDIEVQQNPPRGVGGASMADQVQALRAQLSPQR